MDNMYTRTISVTVVVKCIFLVVNIASAHGRLPPPTHRTFEDYLQNMDKSLQTSIVKLGEDGVIVSTISTSTTSATAATTPISGTVDEGNVDNSSIVDRIPEDEKKNVTCCILGELAGDKGFHCFAEFYAARILLRNMNRAHNRKMGFHGRYKIPKYGEKIMKTFEQCVAGHGVVFHRCCYLATMERTTVRRNQTPRRGVASVDD